MARACACCIVAVFPVPMTISPLAGKLPEAAMLVNVSQLVAAYFSGVPDPQALQQQVAFGTSGHRGCPFDHSFNEGHVVAISQAICDYRRHHDISGPLFLGIDTHALSVPACASALEVLAAHGIEVMLAEKDDYTPTPAVSHAIIRYNRGRDVALADGMVITPSHNPPEYGGIKYNSPNGEPADTSVTRWIESRANDYLRLGFRGVKRMGHDQALRAATTHRYDFLNAYVDDLGAVLDMAAIRDAKLRLGVDPLGGAGVHYWPAIAARYQLDLTVVNPVVDPTFRFIPLDWDGRIRMDPSSRYAMMQLFDFKEKFYISLACDADHDRHGIVTRGAGLLPANHYLSVAIQYVFQHRPQWRADAAVGKTVVSSQMIDRVAAKQGRKLFEVPAGFKWFANGLFDGTLGFAGEESAGATLLRRDGHVWTTDKDGIVAALLAAEMTARMGRDPGELYQQLTQELGVCVSARVEAPATPAQKKCIAELTPQHIRATHLAGEKIRSVLTLAPGNAAPIGGVKVMTDNGWFAARPSGTEDIYKIYAESFVGDAHLRRVVEDAQTIVDGALATAA